MKNTNLEELGKLEQMNNVHRQALVSLVHSEHVKISYLNDYRRTYLSLGEVSQLSEENRIYRLNLLESAIRTVYNIRSLRKTIKFLFEQK